MADPITPPPELVRHWSRFQGDTDPEALWFRIANEAAQWGADRELEATLGLMETLNIRGVDYIRNVRRPKPSLKEQAFKILNPEKEGALWGNFEYRVSTSEAATIRRALEALDD
jgi:hypothetical protein